MIPSVKPEGILLETCDHIVERGICRGKQEIGMRRITVDVKEI